MGATYDLKIVARVNGFGDPIVTFPSVSGGWDNINVSYFTSSGLDGVSIDIPASLEVEGPIQVNVLVEQNLNRFTLETSTVSNPRRILIFPSKIKTDSITNPYFQPEFALLVRGYGSTIPGTGTFPDKYINITVPVFVKKASSLTASDNTFNFPYIKSFNSFNNNAVRLDMNGQLTYASKDVLPGSSLSNVNVDATTDLSNVNGQYLLTVNLVNDNGVVSVASYPNTMCPNVTDVTVDESNIIVSVDSELPNLALFQLPTSSGVKVPNIVQFDPTYQSGLTSESIIYLSWNDKLSNLITTNEQLSMLFLFYIPINE